MGVPKIRTTIFGVYLGIPLFREATVSNLFTKYIGDNGKEAGSHHLGFRILPRQWMENEIETGGYQGYVTYLWLTGNDAFLHSLVTRGKSEGSL